MSSSTFFSVCYAAQAYTTSWLSYVTTIYYYTQTYSYSCGWWSMSRCSGYRQR